MSFDMNQLSVLAGKFKGFLGFTAFVFLVFFSLYLYSFSQGSFDTLIKIIPTLDKQDIVGLIKLFMWMSFFILVLLIILAYRSIKPTEKTAELKTPDSIRIIVYKHGRRSDFVEGALVNLAPENKGSTQQKISNAHGSVEFDIPTATHELKFYISASKENHQASEEKHITVKTGENNPFAIELNPN